MARTVDLVDSISLARVEEVTDCGLILSVPHGLYSALDILPHGERVILSSSDGRVFKARFFCQNEIIKNARVGDEVEIEYGYAGYWKLLTPHTRNTLRYKTWQAEQRAAQRRPADAPIVCRAWDLLGRYAEGLDYKYRARLVGGRALYESARLVDGRDGQEKVELTRVEANPLHVIARTVEWNAAVELIPIDKGG